MVSLLRPEYFLLALLSICATKTFADVDVLEGTAGGKKYRVEITEPVVIEHEGANCTADRSIRFNSYSFYFRDENPKPTPENAVFSIIIEYRPDGGDALVQWDRIGLALDKEESANSARPAEWGNVYPVKAEWNEREYFHMLTSEPARTRWAWQVHGSECTARFVVSFTLKEV